MGPSNVIFFPEKKNCFEPYWHDKEKLRKRKGPHLSGDDWAFQENNAADDEDLLIG